MEQWVPATHIRSTTLVKTIFLIYYTHCFKKEKKKNLLYLDYSVLSHKSNMYKIQMYCILYLSCDLQPQGFVKLMINLGMLKSRCLNFVKHLQSSVLLLPNVPKNKQMASVSLEQLEFPLAKFPFLEAYIKISRTQEAIQGLKNQYT